MPWRHLTRFVRDDRASVTVEFVAVFGGLVVLVFFIMETTLAFFWWKTAEKSAYLGARLAIVSTAAAGIPERNPKTDSGTYGIHCRDITVPCALNIGDSWICETDGTGCNAPARGFILARMSDIFGVLQADQIRISYTYVGLGYAGGPLIPAVRLTITGVPFDRGFLPVIGRLITQDAAELAVLPDISATLTGEDLDTGAPEA